MVCNIRSIVTGLTDIIFPPRCLICGTLLKENESSFFCSGCRSRINFVKSPQCTRCGLPFQNTEDEDHLCGECILSKPFFSTARALGKYEGALMEAIHLFKYKGKITIGKTLGKLMAQAEYNSLNIRDYSLIIPIPLHRKKLAERGFNQSLILAREIAAEFSMPLDFTTLKRNVYTKSQTTLTRNERKSNVKGAFEINNPGVIKGKRILLIDDVFTTGSTARECSRMLIRHRADEVAVLTLARTVH
jgi:ComF family protein